MDKSLSKAIEDVSDQNLRAWVYNLFLFCKTEPKKLREILREQENELIVLGGDANNSQEDRLKLTVCGECGHQLAPPSHRLLADKYKVALEILRSGHTRIVLYCPKCGKEIQTRVTFDEPPFYIPF